MFYSHKEKRKRKEKNARPPLICATKRSITNFIFVCGLSYKYNKLSTHVQPLVAVHVQCVFLNHECGRGGEGRGGEGRVCTDGYIKA